MSRWDAILTDRLAALDERGQRRVLRAAALRPDGRLLRDGRLALDFSSNDYLGLALHPLLAQRAAEFAACYGAGAGASRLVTGTFDAHLALEARIAALKGTESALLLASGWQANAALVPALVRAMPGAAVFTDRLVHASIHHGCAAAGVRQKRFRHNDLAHLNELLTAHAAAPARIILTESVFSMDGDCADVAGLGALADRHDALLVVDEAHATGVLGPNGAGLSHGVAGVDIAMGTFSKALGGFGGYLACSAAMRDWLVNAAGGFVFSTAVPPAVLGAGDAALDLLPQMGAERANLAALGEQLRAGLAGLGIDTGGSTTQIVPAIIGAEEDALRLSSLLEERGMIAAAIRPPTVPPGTSRLRIALRASHSEDDIARLLAALGEAR
ncbi:8-amino-7-oxononanoate synthase [Croceicoccus sp. Ery15]|uniref:aminotransferase class I/II-fold pyridoxal phosphate-dependent enzyme n=1 Tax=Croceicoccus sp. Ery15 TaxID=1703338 RepID=UPI001E45A9AA|nr:8-amino-7-oxononanoate synthase [Croceicoccus sp. Ery15]